MSYRGKGVFKLVWTTSCYCPFTELLVDSHRSWIWHRDTDECGLTEEMMGKRSEGWVDGWMDECESVCAIVPVTVSWAQNTDLKEKLVKSKQDSSFQS